MVVQVNQPLAPSLDDKDIHVRAMPLDLWQRVKVRAAQDGITVREFVIEALNEA